MSTHTPVTTANPYAAPAVPSDTRAALDPRRLGKRAGGLLFASLGGFVVTILILAVGAPAFVGRVGFGGATLVAVVGGFTGLTSLFATRGMRGVGGLRTAVALSVLANGGMALVGALATWLSTATFTRGRQLRSLGRVLLAPVGAAGDWAALAVPVREIDLQPDDGAGTEPELRAALAAAWRENGRTEHASVAAFARLTLDLMALGAPPSLVAAANRDALDEIRHTELCFSLARALDGESASPGAFPEAKSARTVLGGRTIALAALAVDSLVDGALHEGMSARVVARLVKRCASPAIRDVLKEIAADEGRHAAHGWDVVEWCVAEGGAPVARALQGAIAALPDQMRTTRPAAAATGAWERFGIVGAALEAEELARTRASLVRRVSAIIDESRAAA
jgi:hypothetical protein